MRHQQGQMKEPRISTCRPPIPSGQKNNVVWGKDVTRVQNLGSPAEGEVTCPFEAGAKEKVQLPSEMFPIQYSSPSWLNIDLENLTVCSDSQQCPSIRIIWGAFKIHQCPDYTSN